MLLAALAAILQPALEISLLISVTLTFLKKLNKDSETRGIWAALLGAFLAAFLVVNRYDFFGDREVFEVYLLSAATLAGLLFLAWARWAAKGRRWGGTQALLFVLLTPLLTIKAVEVVLFPSNIFIMTTSVVNSELLIKLTGALLGLVLPVIFGWAFTRASRSVALARHIIVVNLVLAIMLIRQGITLLQLFFALGYLPATPWAVSLIAPIINYYYPAFFYGLLALGWGALIMAYLSSPKPAELTLAGLNPAQRRKILAALRLDKNWVRGALTVLLAIVVLLGANLVYARREVKLSPPTPLQPSGKILQIPLADLADGKLHRFSYVTPNNITMRFIVIKKGANSYGAGLDACEICGTTGYYQRGKNVICKNCDVVINIPTIGFPGGCNPIPLANKVQGKYLVIQRADLEAKEDTFKE